MTLEPPEPNFHYPVTKCTLLGLAGVFLSLPPSIRRPSDSIGLYLPFDPLMACPHPSPPPFPTGCPHPRPPPPTAGSPLRRITEDQGYALAESLRNKGINDATVYVGMRYWHPYTEEAMDQVWISVGACISRMSDSKCVERCRA